MNHMMHYFNPMIGFRQNNFFITLITPMAESLEQLAATVLELSLHTGDLDELI